jgi:Flp pilus assembly protein TadG
MRTTTRQTTARQAPAGNAARRTIRRRADERGFIAITTALLLVVLMLAAALALDVAVWYSKGLALQRTVDAAALAGVIRMPNFSEAEDMVRLSASRNGVDPASIEVARDPSSPRRLKVRLKQTVSSFFGKFARPNTTLTRQATAEFVSSIEMGSKLNAIGTGDLFDFPGLGKQNFWLAINGFCTAKEDGDRFASAYDGNRAGRVASCNPTLPVVKNLDYRKPGTDAPQYTYVVDVPCPTPGETPCLSLPAEDTLISVYNPLFDMSNQPGTIDSNILQSTDPNFGNTQITTSFSIRDTNGDLMIAPNGMKSFGTCNNCTATNGWSPLFQIPKAMGAGRYKVDVNTEEAQTNSYGSNAFSLSATWASVLPGPCASCPSMAGESSISVYANAPGNEVDFFLAQLDPATDFRGKRLQILLWDVDQGADSISILQPTASGYQPFPFRFRTFDHGLDGVPVDDKFPSTPLPGGVLDVSGLASTLGAQAPPWPLTERANDYKFNGRMIALELTVPSDYGCVPASAPCVPAPIPEDGWWKIRYKTSADEVFDRTTWTVRLMGDPVHLVAK